MRKRIFRIRNARLILDDAISRFQARAIAGIVEKTARDLLARDLLNRKALKMLKDAERLRRKYATPE